MEYFAAVIVFKDTRDFNMLLAKLKEQMEKERMKMQGKDGEEVIMVQERSLFPSWYSSMESFDGGLNQDCSREDGKKSDLREMWEDVLWDLVMD